MKIQIKYIPTEYHLEDDIFVCDHAETYSDTIEHYDHYAEAVTGNPQALSYEPIEVCDECDSYYSQWSEEWVWKEL